MILIAASGVFRSSCTANCSYVYSSHPTTKPRLGPPGCILNCCGVVVWSGQQQHAGPCITLSSFLEIPNGSRVRVWDAAAAGLLHSYSLRSCRTFQTTSLTHLPPLPLYYIELETNPNYCKTLNIAKVCLQLYSAPLVFKVWLWLVSIITGALAIKYWYSCYYINFSWRKQSY